MSEWVSGLIGVIGAGVMGRSVAEAAIRHDLRVVLIDVSNDALQQARSEIRRNLRGYAIQNPGVRVEPLMERLVLTLDYTQVSTVPLIVENVTEDAEIKREVYTLLDSHAQSTAIIAANTSTIPISELAESLKNPRRLVGIHFMNPVYAKPLVEIIRGRNTSTCTLRTAQDFLKRLDMSGTLVEDTPGFVTNRVLMLTINEAIRVVESGTAAPETVDQLFVGCFGHAMGPLATGDLIGLDTILLSLLSLQARLADAKFEPSQLLRNMVASNRLGRKTGSGFFEYSI